MTGAAIRAAYAEAFADYLCEPGEHGLRTAYELGRKAVERGVGVLELASIHHDVLLSHLQTAATVERTAAAAGDFFLESLASFEMARRSSLEAREEARLEQRQTALLRQLSNFLTDASLATDGAESVGELLQLVAEQSRELIGAECCAVALVSETVRAVCHDEVDAEWSELVDAAELGELYTRMRGDRGLVLVTRAELERACPSFAWPRPRRGWLAAPLTALDGRGLGLLHLFDKETGKFSDLDGELVLQLAQMASAAVERVSLHARPAAQRRG